MLGLPASVKAPALAATGGCAVAQLIASCHIIYPEKIPGVPSFIAKGIVPKIEQLISKEVAKNLAATAKVVEKFINSK